MNWELGLIAGATAGVLVFCHHAHQLLIAILDRQNKIIELLRILANNTERREPLPPLK